MPTVNDVTQLNRISVLAIATPQSTEEIQHILKSSSFPISIGGGHFSMGGQTASPGSLHMDLRQLNKILSFDVQDKTIRVQAGPSSEVSVATTGAASVNTLTWAANSLSSSTAYKIYRSTSSGAEVYLSTVTAPQISYVDTGSISTVAGLTTPTASQIRYNRGTGTGESTNTIYYGGNGANAVLTNTTLSLGSGYYGVQPDMVLSNDHATVALMGMGDSISYGTGDDVVDSVGILGAGWFTRGARAANVYADNLALFSATLSEILSNASNPKKRLYGLQFGGYLVNQLGTNDITDSIAWGTVLGDHLILAATKQANGGRYVITTLTPETTSTDNFITTTNQTQTNNPTQRMAYNAALRCSTPVPVLATAPTTPVTCGTANAVASSYIFSVFDLAASVECNSSNVVTPGGGYWCAPTSAALNCTVSGSPSTTSVPITTTMTASQYVDYALKMTSGAASGQYAVVTANTTTTLTLAANGSTYPDGHTVIGLTTSPSSGDTCQLWETNTNDGIHPSSSAHIALGALWSSFITANLPAY